MKSMIPHEHDHSVVCLASLLNGSQHSAHLVVHEADSGVVSSPQFSLLTEYLTGKMSYVRKYFYMSHFVIRIGDICFNTNVRNSSSFR